MERPCRDVERAAATPKACSCFLDSGTPIDQDAGPTGPTTTSPQPLIPGWGSYPRAIRVQSGNIVVSVIGQQANGHRGGTILKSSDDGVTFSVVGHIEDPSFANGACCSTLYVLPRAVGNNPAGTLLWAASLGAQADAAPMSITVWASQNEGETWSKQSNAVVATVPRSKGGLWEPEFSLLDDGTLVCHFSDETASGHSQRLGAVRTTDLVTWSAPFATVALNDALARPGMANVRRGPGGTYFMSYELCYIPSKAGPHPENCAAHIRTSTDGVHWGDANDPGIIPKTADGKEFRHAPTLAWSPNPGPNGRFYLVGQMLYDSAGQKAADNGKLIFANTDGSQGSWYEIAAPVPVPSAENAPCPNYSSTVLPLDNDSVVLEVAAHYEDSMICHADFARGRVH